MPTIKGEEGGVVKAVLEEVFELLNEVFGTRCCGCCRAGMRDCWIDASGVDELIEAS
jgi:hypothetical protein